MKVVSVCHMFPNRINPNIGVFVKERVKFVGKKIELTMIAPVPSFPFMNYISKYGGLAQLEDKEVIDGLTVFHPRYFMIPKYLKYFDGIFYGKSLESYIENLFDNGKFDILDFHWVYPDGIGGLQWAHKFAKKTIVTVRGNEAIYYFDKTIIRKIIQKKLADFDHVIVVSNDLKNKVLQCYGVEQKRVSVIPNGIDRTKFYRMNSSEAIKRCGLESDKKYILTVSRFSKEKGLEHLLLAFKKMKSTGTDLIIIGDGPLKSVLITMCATLGIEDRVHFIGPVGHIDLCNWYNAANVFCLPSLWEGCPNVVIEALACGVPVVATNVGGIPDLIPGSDYGTLVPPGDSDALSLALKIGLEKNWDRKKIFDVGSENSWDDVADKVINVFKMVLS